MRSREDIAAVLRDIKTLPTLPDVAMKVLELSQDPDVSPRALADTVESDAAIATRLLKLVNSPYYGVRGTVTSIHQALLFLGVSNLRNLVLSTSTMDLFSQEGEIGSFSRKELWYHSLATALAAREMAKRMRVTDPEVAFTAGLIHDVGKVVIDRFFHEEFKRIVDLMDKYGVTMQDAEHAVIGMDHGEVGHYLAQRWSLPAVLQDAVGYHHTPRAAAASPTLAALIGYADFVAWQLRGNSSASRMPQLEEGFFDVLPLEDAYLDNFAEDFAEPLAEQLEQLASAIRS